MELENLGWNNHFSNQISTDNFDKTGIGRVIDVQKNSFRLLGLRGECRAKLSGSFSFNLQSAFDLPVVGDWVLFNKAPDDDTAIIHTLLNRQNSISRKAAGSSRSKEESTGRVQVMAANVDTVFIVSGLDRDFNPRRIERYLTLVYDSHAMPVVLLNKADLCGDAEDKRFEIESIAIGAPVLLISARSDDCIDVIRPYLMPGYTAALLGSSGVGKSTLINALLGRERQKVKSVSEAVGKGTHTTTHRELILLPEGGMIIDTPGMRELQLQDFDEGLDVTFEDIEQLATCCRFSDCGHDSEPGCAVIEAIEQGDLDPDRLQSYLKLKREISYYDDRETKSSRVIEKEKWKKIRILQRNLKKHPKHRGN